MEAIRSYRLAAAGPAAAQPALRAALRLAAERLPARWLARYWGGRVEAAQAPNPLSARDGLLLRAVPRAARLDPGDLEAVLCAALEADDELAHELRDQACEAWASGEERLLGGGGGGWSAAEAGAGMCGGAGEALLSPSCHLAFV